MSGMIKRGSGRSTFTNSIASMMTCFVGLTLTVSIVSAQAAYDERVRRGYLGVGIVDISPEIQQKLNLKTQRGVLVGKIAKGSPAETAGLKKYDIIVQINSQAVSGSGQFRSRIGEISPGKTVQIRFIRGQSTHTAKATLDEHPTSKAYNSENQQTTGTGGSRAGHATRGNVPMGDPPPDDGSVNLLGQGNSKPVRNTFAETVGRNEGAMPRLHRAEKGSLGKDVIVGRWQATKHHFNEEMRYGTYKGFSQYFMTFKRGSGDRLYVGNKEGYAFDVLNAQRVGPDSFIYTGKTYKSDARPGAVTMVDSFRLKITISAEGFIEMYYWGTFGQVFYKV